MLNTKTLLKALAGSTAISLFMASAAHAQTKTLADTTVTNTFSLNYKVGGNDAPEINSQTGTGGAPAPTTFKVDRLVDLTVTSTTPTVTVNPGDTGEELGFTVVNDGNDTQAYSLSIGVGTGNTANESIGNPDVVYYIDNLSTGTQGVLDAADGFDGNPASATTYNPSSPPVLAPDQTLFVFFRKDFAANESDGTFAEYTLIADTLENAPGFAQMTADTDGNDFAVTENVLLDGKSTAFETEDPGGGGTIGVGTGDQSAAAQYNVASATIAGSKTVIVYNQDGAGNCNISGGTPQADGYPIPGACVEYTITVTNTGSIAATDLSVSDTLPGEVTYYGAVAAGDLSGGTLSEPGGGIGTDCVSDACPVVLSDVTLPATSGSGTLTIRAIIK